MKWKKWIVIGLVAIIVLVAVFFVWYKQMYSMGVIDTIEINTRIEKRSMLIATQESEFKNAVTAIIVDKYKEDNFYINVVDVTSLPQIESKDYDVIVLLHTWENWKPPSEVATFIQQNKYRREKIVVVTTSGKGSYKMSEVDAITGESILLNASKIARKVMLRVDEILQKESLEK